MSRINLCSCVLFDTNILYFQDKNGTDESSVETKDESATASTSDEKKVTNAGVSENSEESDEHDNEEEEDDESDDEQGEHFVIR